MIGDPNGVYVLDETGFLKKGKKSVGVQRQYSGTKGPRENCQIGVFLAYATGAGHTLVDRALYLPSSVGCKTLGDVGKPMYQKRWSLPGIPQLAAKMLWHALESGLEAKWVTGDSVYGSNRPRLPGLEKRKKAYALCVRCSEKVVVPTNCAMRLLKSFS